MKKSCITTLVIVLAFSSFPLTVYANLLDNSGFEEWQWTEGVGEFPEYWQYAFDYPTVIKESTVVKSGSYSVKIAVIPYGNYWTGLSQEQPFTAGDTLYAYQPVNIPGVLNYTSAILQIHFKNSNGDCLSVYRVERATTTNNWEALIWTGLAPPGTAKFEYLALMRGWGTSPFSETIYFDDAYADTVPIPEPAGLLLFGIGLIGHWLSQKIKENRNKQVLCPWINNSNGAFCFSSNSAC